MPVLVSLGLGSAPAVGCLLLAGCCAETFVVFVGILHVQPVFVPLLASFFSVSRCFIIYFTSVLRLPPSPLPARVWQVGDVRRLLPSQQILEDQSLS